MYQVLNCITGLNVGGAEYMLARFARTLSGTAYNPLVLSLMMPGPVSAILRDQGISVQTLAMGESRLSVAAFARLRSAVVRTDSDILHGWMYHGNVAASIGALFGQKQPVIWSIHHSVDDISAEKRLTRWLIRLQARLSSRTSAISYCSSVSADQHEALGFDPSKRIVIPNGVDCDEFQPVLGARQLLCSSFNIPSGRFIIGNVARAHPMKNHDGFVRTVATLVRAGHDVHGVIIGAGHEDGAARRAARELGVDDRLTTPGTRSDIAKLLPGLDLFMLSSAWGEAFPLSVAEAMACGVPAIATNVGDCHWLVGNDDLVSAPRDIVAQAGVAERILGLGPEGRRHLGLAGRARVLKHFSLQKYRDSHLQLYEAALEDGVRRRRA